MMLKYPIALAILLVLAAVFTWAFLPARYLPGNRARHLRIRLHLRLHPGRGFAHIFGLWLRWGRLAVLRRSGRIRPSLPLWYRTLDRNTAITAMILADLVGEQDLHEGHRLWPHIQSWAGELGLTAPDAIERASQPPRDISPYQERASEQPDLEAAD